MILRRKFFALTRCFAVADALDPFNPRRSLMDVFNLVDQMLDSPFGAGRGTAGGAWRGWDAREDDKALYLKVEMPGLGKDDVQVMVENNSLAIKGEASEKEGEDGGEVEQGGEEGRERGRRRYSSRIELPENEYELEGIKAEMRNGVLRVVVPKVKQEERKGVRHVLVE